MAQSGEECAGAAVFYLGETVPARSLQQAQAYIDVLTRSPAPPSHPFTQVLEALRSASRRRQRAAPVAPEPPRPHGGSDGEAEEDGADGPFGPAAALSGGPRMASGSRQQTRKVLQDAFGDFEGSALYRQWVQRPHAHLCSVSRDLGRAVLQQWRRYQAGTGTEPSAASAEAEEDLDVHVQLCPSPAPGRGRPAHTFAAVVTLRYGAALREAAAQERALATRLLSVAAPGQTVAGSLQFWRDVSYTATGGVAAPAVAVLEEAGVAQYAPLGLTSVLGTAESLSVSPPPPGRRRPREDAGGESDEPTDSRLRARGDGAAATAAVTLGSWASVSAQMLSCLPQVADDAEDELAAASPRRLAAEMQRAFETAGTAGCPWLQPDALLLRGPPGVTAARRGASAGPLLRHSAVGLAAVLYVSAESVAYVAYPPPPRRGANESVRASGTPPAPPEMATAAATHTQPREAARWHGLPLEARDSFARALLGL